MFESLDRKNEKAITLIALVITIIVLLILVGVTINVVLGPEGLLKKAQDATKLYEEAQAKEIDAINKFYEKYLSEETKDTKPGELEKINETTYAINSIEDLVAFSNNVNKGTSYEGITIKLNLNLDFNDDISYVDPTNTSLFGDYNQDGTAEGIKQELIKQEAKGFIPIGTKVQYDESFQVTGGNSFKGTFEGNSKAIKNIYINYTEATEKMYNSGLFGVNQGTIQNLVVSGTINTNSTVAEGRVNVGGIVGLNLGTVKKCDNYANVTSNNCTYRNHIGGIAGYNGSNTTPAKILGSSNKARISSDTVGYMYLGGISGFNNSASEVSESYNEGEMLGENITESGYVAGIIAYNFSNGIVNNCYNIAKVTNMNTNKYGYAGGVTAFNLGEILNSNNRGEILLKNVITNNGYIGGVTGYNGNSTESGTVRGCYNEGIVTADTGVAWLMVGGVVGYNQKGTVDNCYNTANVTENNGNSPSTGGIIGYQADANGIINNCYNTAEITNENSKTGKLGGIVGYNNGDILNSFNKGDILLNNGGSNIGGIGGQNGETVNIQNCYNEGEVIANNCNVVIYIGGIFGFSNNAKLKDCHNSGNITCEVLLSALIGGITGDSRGEGSSIEKCYNIGKVNAINSSKATGYMIIGGVLGQGQSVDLTENYNKGEIGVKGSFTNNIQIGGIAGYTIATYGSNEYVGKIQKCYNTGNLVAEASCSSYYIGGIIGDTCSLIYNCFNTGYINTKCTQTSDANSSFVGGLIGSMSRAIELKNSYNKGNMNISVSNPYKGSIIGNTSISRKYNNK